MFTSETSSREAEEALRAQSPEAHLAAVQGYAGELTTRLRGNATRPASLLLFGTERQLEVWEAPGQIAPGSVLAYSDDDGTLWATNRVGEHDGVSDTASRRALPITAW